MARYKKAKGAVKQASSTPNAGLPCVILIIAAVIFTMALMYWALRASGT